MELMVILVLGLAGLTTQDSQESLKMKNLKKLNRFPAIQSFLKHLYAHKIQGLPHSSGNDRSDHRHDHWHGLQDGNQNQEEKTSSYTNIQNVNLIVKGNRAGNPLNNLEHLKPFLKNMKSVKEIDPTISRCGDGRCDDDRNNNHQNRVEESLDKILNNIKQDHDIMNKVKPVLPYWGEMSGISVNNNSYDDRQDHELRCGCNRVAQREGTNGNSRYDLRCGCSRKQNNFRDETLEEGNKYDLRCGCNSVSEREGNNGNDKYNLRCGCRKELKRSFYQRERSEDNEQYNLRCGCDRVSQRDNNGQYDLRCGCSRSFEREGSESNGQYDLRCGCGQISEEMGDNGRYNLRCGCSRGSQREGIKISSQYDLRCGCSRASQREGVDSNGQYDLRCGCSRSSTEGVMDENNEQYNLRCGCDRVSQRDNNGQYDLRCGCSRSFEREGSESNGQYDLRCGCGQISEEMGDNGRYNLRCGCSRGSQREGIEINSQYDLRCGCSRASQREGVDSNGQYDLRCGCSRSSTEGVMDENNEQYDLRCGCSRNSYREGNSNGQLDLRCGCTDKRGRNLVEFQSPRYDSKNVMSINLDDGDEDQGSVINGKTRLVNKVNEEPPVSYPDSMYMGLDPNDKYFTKINKELKSKVSLQGMVTFYNAWKEQMLDNLVSYVIRDSDSIDESHMTEIQRRIVRNLRSKLSNLKYVDGRKLRNRLTSLLFGVESPSRVLPHDESQDVYVPRWVYNLLKHAYDKTGLRKGRVSWFPMSKKQKLRLQTIIQKQKAANNAKYYYSRRSQSPDAGYGVPFDMEVQGLAQVNS